MSAPTVSAEDMRSTLRSVAMNRMMAAMAALRLEPPCGILTSVLETAPESNDAERRYPMMLIVAEAAAEIIGRACNCWSGKEREVIFERIVARMNDRFVSSKDEVDGWMAEIDPLRAMAREKAEETPAP